MFIIILSLSFVSLVLLVISINFYKQLLNTKKTKKDLEDKMERVLLGMAAADKARKSNKTPEEIIRENDGRWN